MIAVQNLHVRRGGFSLSDLSFAIPGGRYAVLMGPTGCGKSTVLETLCGLQRARSGRIVLSDRDVTGLEPAVRNVGYVPQDGALFPTLDVRGNIGFALTVRRWPVPRIEARVRELAGLLGLEALLDRSTHHLSGGEAQRVALGRALAFDPPVLLLDEPLSALDDETRSQMWRLLRSVHAHTGVTVLHVTHNAEDASQLADLVFAMQHGTITENPR